MYAASFNYPVHNFRLYLNKFLPCYNLGMNTQSQYWDGLAASYDKRESDPVYMGAVEAVCRLLAPQDGDRILDAGCGTGIPLRRYYRDS